MAAVLRRPVSAALSSAASNNTPGKLNSATTTTTGIHIAQFCTTAATMSSSSSSPSASASASASDSRDSQTCTLPDGRKLGFAEYGAADGHPVIYFHGFPSSRLEGSVADKFAKRHKVRLLCLDRPGFGLSTLQPGRRLLDWPDDVLAFASSQNLNRFGIFGASGGGPYTLACARKLPPGMLTHVGIMCGAGPFDASLTKAVPRRSRITAFLATYWPWGLRMMVAGVASTLQWLVRTRTVSRWIDQWIEGMDKKKAERKAEKAAEKAADKKAAAADATSEGSVVGEDFEEVAAAASVESLSTVATKLGSSKAIDDDDQEVDIDEEEDETSKLTVPQRREAMFRALFDPFTQGAEPTVQDAQVLCSDFGIRYEDISFGPIMFWHGDSDANTPLAWVQPVADRIPHAVLKVYPGKSHYSIVQDLDEIIAHFAPKAAVEEEKTEK